MPRLFGYTLTFVATLAFLFGAADSDASKPQCRGNNSCPPTNTALPSISGTAPQGQTLLASAGSWNGTSPIAFAYQWRRCDVSGANCTAISGATSQSYVLSLSDVGATIRVSVTASNVAGSSSANSVQTPVVAAAIPLSNTAPPSISGTIDVGQTLTASPGSWSGTTPISYAYQWLHCDSNGANCASFSGATAQTYLLVSADVGSTLRVKVTATNVAGSTSAQSAPTGVVGSVAPPSNTTLPSISGITVSGQTLTASTGSWSGAAPISYAYQWLRCDSSGASCASISGATNQSYLLVSADVGRTMRVQVTASNSVGSRSVWSAPTAVEAASSTSTSSSSIYWGAGINGQDTYGYLYGGTWGEPPWDDKTWNKFESNAGKKVALLSWNNSVPWTHDFNYFLSMHEKVRSRGDLSVINMNSGSVPLRDIANGRYDSSLKTWAQQVAAWGHPLFLTFDVEMNGNWEPYSPGVNGNTASDFVNAWRHFHDLAVQAGATNITWVWCVNRDPGLPTAYYWTPYDQLYPGDAYVDWTGLDGFNRTGSQSFSSLYSASYSKLLQLASSKPIMIGQIGSVEGGTPGKAAWITDALSTQLPTYFPRIKALVWFNWRMYQNGTWWNWEIESSSTSQAAFATAISTSYYAPGGSFGSLPLRSKIAPP